MHSTASTEARPPDVSTKPGASSTPSPDASAPPNPATPPRSEAASRGLPSRAWQAGQDRRFALIRRYARLLEGARVVDIGCGIGIYTARMREAGARAAGLEIDWPRVLEARAAGIDVIAAVGEALPFADGTVDLVLLHEVLEHVASDRRTAREVTRVLAPGGRALIFVPNRWWPFETHGIVWRGRYRFGNIPLVNYLPDPARNRLAPHVRVYTAAGLRAVFDGLPLRVIAHSQVYPGYDKLVWRRPRLGRLARRLTYALERTPLRRFGLSHFLVLERSAG